LNTAPGNTWYCSDCKPTYRSWGCSCRCDHCRIVACRRHYDRSCDCFCCITDRCSSLRHGGGQLGPGR
jgi:hypothetical protein